MKYGFVVALLLIASFAVAQESRPAAPPRPQTPAAPVPEAGSQRNQNIPINLIDNNALNESLNRQGAQAVSIREFSAVRANFAAEFGGLGRNLEIATPESRETYHGEAYEMLQNNIFNARTFFQVGSVQKHIRNQYGFSIGGPAGSDRVSFYATGEDTRQTGYVNGNVLVPLSNERTPLTTDPAAYALIAKWLSAYPKQTPNRTEIDPRMLNTNAPQTIRITTGSGRVDWRISDARQFNARYSLTDTFINSFKFIAGMNPDQRFRPQTYNLAFDQRFNPNDSLRLGVNYLRQKSVLSVPPGAVGPRVGFGNQIDELGPRDEMPIRRVRNDFEYLAVVTNRRNAVQTDWGADIRRFQMNDLQSNDARGAMFFNANFGKTAVENFLLGLPSFYRITLGNLYRGFRNTDWNLFLNERWNIRQNLTLNLGTRYEFAGAPSEVNHLTTIPYKSDRNNVAPRVGFAYNKGANVLRGGYGIAFGRVFPATFQLARWNPPEIVRITLTNPDLLNPLKDFTADGGNSRSTIYRLDDDLVAPYSQQYTLEFERVIKPGLRARGAYIGSRTWKLFQSLPSNRAGRPPGIPVTTATINDRRPDQRYYTIYRYGNMGRAYFDAGQFSLERITGPATFSAIFTWSKAIDTGTSFSNTQANSDELKSQVENGVLQDMRAPSLFDVRRSLVLSYAVPLPTRILKGWMLTGTTLLRSGTPFNVEIGSDSPGVANVDGEFPDRPTILDTSLLGRSVDNPDTSQSILRRSAFSTDDAMSIGRGNIGRNAMRKDGAANVNLALARTFALPQMGSSLSFRAEVVNLTNHPQFDAPKNALTAPSFGQITNTLNAGRSMQFVMNLRF